MCASILLASVGLVLCSIGPYLMVRNLCVWTIRKAFIEDDSLWPWGYEALPSYDEMMLHPKYCHLWTKAQWVQWVNS